jgi:hypothetical protein
MDAKWDQLPHVFLTSEQEWDPSILDHDHSDDGPWFDDDSDDDFGPASNLFDEFGNYHHRVLVQCSEYFQHVTDKSLMLWLINVSIIPSLDLVVKPSCMNCMIMTLLTGIFMMFLSMRLIIMGMTRVNLPLFPWDHAFPQPRHLITPNFDPSLAGFLLILSRRPLRILCSMPAFLWAPFSNDLSSRQTQL